MNAIESGAAKSNVIEQNCPECGKPLRIPAQLAGQFGKCPHCGEMVLANHASSVKKAVAATPAGTRLKSLDVLRGFDMFWIIGADAISRALMKLSGGEEAPAVIKGIATQLEHVRWEGFRFYDLIFPLFVFMVGMAAIFSLHRIVEKEGKRSAIKRIVRRAALLLLLGALYDVIDTTYGDGIVKALTDENLLCGVLQRLAYCYLATGLLICAFNVRGIAATFVIILVAYWAALTFIPAPGEAEVVFERGRNIIHYIDQHIPPYYGTDPESLMTTFPAIATCLLGALAAVYIRESGSSAEEQARWLFIAGIAMVVAGYLWGMQMPIIKRLWTPSYIFVSGGYSLMLLGALTWIIDVRGWEGWEKPFLWIGANSIAVYYFENVVDLRSWAGFALGKDGIAPGLEAFLSLLGLSLAIVFVYVLNKKKIYIRV